MKNLLLILIFCSGLTAWAANPVPSDPKMCWSGEIRLQKQPMFHSDHTRVVQASRIL